MNATSKDKSYHKSIVSFGYAVSMLFAILVLLPTQASAASANSLANGITVNLTVYGAPAGSHFLWRVAPNYTTINTTITGYVTHIPIWFSNSTINTYHGSISWQYQGQGTTLSKNGSTFTMLTTNVVNTCTSQTINVINSTHNNCIFYLYLNAPLWTSNEVAEVKAVNSSYANALIVLAGINNSTATSTYNGTINAGGFKKNAAISTIATFNSIKVQSFNFINTSITQATPNCAVNLNGQSYSRAGAYSIPEAIINGHLGFSSSTYYWLNGSLSCSNLNALPLNYSLHFSNGTTAFIGTPTATSLNQPFSYKVPIGLGVNLVLDAHGNANYTNLDPSFTKPASVNCWDNISIQNTQSPAIGNYLQVMIATNTIGWGSCFGTPFFDGSANNVEFFYPNGTIAQSWFEGNVLNEGQTTGLNTISGTNAVWWVKLNPSIAGTTTATNVISIGSNEAFQNLLNGVAVGESPILSPAYAEYDNGANVFNFYDNFKGTSLSGTWTAINAGYGTVNNGLTLTGSGSSGGYYNNFKVASGNVIDTYMDAITGEGRFGVCTDGTNSGVAFEDNPISWTIDIMTSSANPSCIPNAGGNSGGSSASSTWYLVSGAYIAGAQTLITNYATTQVTETQNPLAYGTLTVPSYGFVDIIYQWIRARTAPPNNIQPTAIFGPFQPAGLPSISLGANPITYGASTTVTATCTPNTDTCGVESPLGTSLCSGTGSCTYTIPNYPAGGTETYYANDITKGIHTSGALTVNQATPLLYYQATCANTIFGGSSCTTTANIVSINNQLTGNFFLNSGLLGSTTTTISNSIGELGSFTYTFNTLGNGNYVTARNSYTFYMDENAFVENTIATRLLTEASTPFTFNTYYPIEIYTQSPLASLAYTLTGAYFANAPVTLVSNAANITYIPPPNQVTGNYIYTIYEFDGADPYHIAITVAANALNMTDIASALTFNNPIIQYYPNQAYNPTWTATPQAWELGGNGYNSPTGYDTFSNGSIIFPTNAYLNYGFTAFTANYINNPLLQQTITQSAWQMLPTSTGIYTQPGQQWNILDGTSFLGVPSPTTTFRAIFTVNNYTFNANFIQIGSNSFQIFFPLSNYQNPNTVLANQISTDAAGNYLSTTNYWFSNTIVYPGSLNYNVYMSMESAPVSYEIAVQNVTTQQYLASVIQVWLYNVATNSSSNIGTLTTLTGGGAFTFLNQGSYYYFVAYTPGGAYLATSPTIQAEPCSSGACLEVIQIGTQNVTVPTKFVGNLLYHCTQTPEASNTELVSCNVGTSNGTSETFSLTLYSGQGNTIINCQQYITTSNGVLQCTAANTAQNYYTYYLKAEQTAGQWVELWYGQFGLTELPFGFNGIFLTIMIIIVLTMTWLSKNINVMLLMIGAAVLASYFMKLFAAPAIFIGAFLMALAVIMFIVNRGNP
jgi:hypothetical protein